MAWYDAFSADDAGGGFNAGTTANITDAAQLGVTSEFLGRLDPSMSVDERNIAIDQERARLAEIQYNSSDPYAFGGSQAASDAARSALMGFGAEDRQKFLDLSPQYGTAYNQAQQLFKGADLTNTYGQQIASGTGLGAMSGAESSAIGMQQSLMSQQAALAQQKQGPSVAELQQAAAYDQLASQNMSLAASQRGGATGAGTMMALGANSAQGQQLAQQQAILRAQEQEAFRQFQLQAMSASGQTAGNLATSEAARRDAQQGQALNYLNSAANVKGQSLQQEMAATAGKASLLQQASSARAGYAGAATGIASQELSGRTGGAESTAGRDFQQSMYSQDQAAAKEAATWAAVGSGLQTAATLATKK